MKAIVTTHAQMFQTPDGSVWTKSVYSYDFFKRYLSVFDEIRIVNRMKLVDYSEIKDYLRVDGKNITFFPLPFYHGPWEYFRKYFKIQTHFKNAISGYNCAILRIPDQVSFQLFKKLSKKNIPCGVEVVAHPWDLLAPGNIKTIIRPLLRFYWDIEQKYICKNADAISYVTSNYLQKRYPSKILNLNHKRIETTYTSANLDDTFLFRPKKAEEFLKKELKLVHIAGINNTAKGHSELLKALSNLKKKNITFSMKFIGGGTMLDYFVKMKDQLSLTNEVEFCGNISDKKLIAKILRESDMFIFPSMSEGLPRVLLEAMASGLPCIASNVGGIPELLSEECLIKNAKDFNEISEKIIRFSSDQDLLENESLKNYSMILNHYKAQIVQEKREAFYKALIKCIKYK